MAGEGALCRGGVLVCGWGDGVVSGSDELMYFGGCIQRLEAALCGCRGELRYGYSSHYMVLSRMQGYPKYYV